MRTLPIKFGRFRLRVSVRIMVDVRVMLRVIVIMLGYSIRVMVGVVV